MRFLSLFCLIFTFSMPALADQDIPVKRVVLSTGGLGYFEHGATLSGDQDLAFPVRLNQVNDILKSLLVFDPAGGLQNVSLPGKQPLEQLFRDLPFSQNDLNDPVSLLNSYQGAEVTVENNGRTTTGLLMRVTSFYEVIDDTQVERHHITLMTSAGLKTFVYEGLQSIQWTDPDIQDEIARALKAVRENGQSDQRRLTIGFSDGDARDVSLSYVVEAPLWKTSYRLVLPPEGMENGHLQGWAIVENLTGGDWNDVQLSLTSGNPVTLQQDLYPAYFTSRPYVPLDVFGRVMPRRDDGSVDVEESHQALSGLGGGAMMKRARNFAGDEMLAEEMMMADQAAAMVASPAPTREIGTLANMTAGQNVATSSEATAQVQFTFPQRFTLESGKTMMVPFVDQDLQMETVALYQPEQHADHPFLSVSVENKSGSTLPPGILTIYSQKDADSPLEFVGDSQMAFFPKSEKRMISYALDQKTKIDRNHKNNRRVGSLRVQNGVLQSAVRYINETVYTVKAPEEESRRVIIEHPRMGNYKLTGNDETVEVTKTHYRIPIEVKPGETKPYTARLVRTSWETVHINSMSADQIMALVASNDELDEKTMRAISALAEMRKQTAAIERQIRDLEMRRNEIYSAQNRIRENIKALSGKSDLKDRYLGELNDQEDSLEDINEKIQALHEALREKQTEMRDMISALEL